MPGCGKGTSTGVLNERVVAATEQPKEEKTKEDKEK